MINKFNFEKEGCDCITPCPYNKTTDEKAKVYIGSSWCSTFCKCFVYEDIIKQVIICERKEIC